MKSWKAAVAILLVLAAVGALVYVRAGDDEPSDPVTLQSQRYCDLSLRFEGLLADAGVPVVGAVPASVPPAAVQKIFADLGPQAEELERTAPAEIRSDVTTVLGALREAAGGQMAAAGTPAFIDAESRILAFRQRPGDELQPGCQIGGGAGDL